MNSVSSRAMIHGIVVCFWLVMCYQVCVMCCVVRWCAVSGGPFSCAPSPAEVWPLNNLPGRGFDGVSCIPIIHSTSTNNAHLRYDNPAKCPRALVPFVVVANVACSYCLLQIISTGPYRLAQQTLVLQEGHFTPYDHVFTLCQQMQTEPVEMLTIWLVSSRNRPRNRPRDVRFRFRSFPLSSRKTDRNRPTFG